MSTASADSLSPGHGDDADDFNLEDALIDSVTKRRKSHLHTVLKRRKQIDVNGCDFFFGIWCWWEGGRGYNCLIISAWETQGLGLQTGVAGDSPGEAGC